MKNRIGKTKLTVCLLTISFFAKQELVEGSLILTKGRAFEFEFHLISPYAYSPPDETTSGSPPFKLSLDHDPAAGQLPFPDNQIRAEFDLGAVLDAEDKLLFSVFENSTEEPAIRSGTVESLPGLIGASFHLANLPFVPWQDRQGILRIEVVSGTIELDSFTAGTVIGDQAFRQTYAVPEPNTVALLFVGMGVFYRRWKTRK